jgi:hypothetical protein
MIFLEKNQGADTEPPLPSRFHDRIFGAKKKKKKKKTPQKTTKKKKKKTQKEKKKKKRSKQRPGLNRKLTRTDTKRFFFLKT